MIKCGKCGERHSNVAEVKGCYEAEAGPTNWTAGFAEQDAAESRERDRRNVQRAARPATAYEGAEVARKSGRRLASTKQVSFLRQLLADRDIPPYENAWVVEIEAELGNEDLNWGNDGDGDMGMLTPLTLSSYDAHRAIDKLIRLPKRTMYTDSRQAKVNASIQQDGMYRDPESGAIWKVQWNRASGDGRHLYASAMEETVRPVLGEDGEVITPGKRRFQFVAGAIARIRPEWRLSLDEARRFGALYGTCVYGHALTKEESIRKGIGPVCEEKYGYPIGYVPTAEQTG